MVSFEMDVRDGSLPYRVTVPWPNYDIDVWRNWLLENVGDQGAAWQWGISRIGDPDLIDVIFQQRQGAMLFILKWTV